MAERSPELLPQGAYIPFTLEEIPPGDRQRIQKAAILAKYLVSSIAGPKTMVKGGADERQVRGIDEWQ